MSKYRKINEVLDDDITGLFINRFACIKLKLNDNQKAEVEYEGNFADLIGLATDMINGLVTQHKKNVEFGFWLSSLKNYDRFLSYVQNRIDDISFNAEISISIDSEQYISAVYNTNIVCAIIMFRFFIDKFCEDYKIDPNEFLEYLLYSHEYFEETNAAKNMHVTEL